VSSKRNSPGSASASRPLSRWPSRHSPRSSSATAHLAERLTGLQDGEPKVFRDTAITNFTEFFDRFRRLNVRSNPELDALVDQARQVITGIEPQQLRDSVRLRAMVANDFTRIEQAVGELLVDRPRRNILRRGQTGAGA
jgi:hypothetical protein